MILRTLAALLVLLVARDAGADTVGWRNGLWFDGTGFTAGTRYSRDGVFVDSAKKVDRWVELGGRHVVPAYGDAHHHGIDSSEALEDKLTVFLEAGIFYVKNPNAIAELLTPEVRARVRRPAGVEVVFATGGLTSRGGHPAPLHDYAASLGVYRGLTPADMEDRAYFVVESAAELEAKWPRILAGRPDFIKVFLLFSEEHEVRRSLAGVHRGLDPRLLPAVVRKAGAANLRVTAHVDTAADFRAAVEAGVDEINHLPQPDPRFSPDLAAYVIDPATARRAAERGITVVATAGTTERLSGKALDPAGIPAMRANQRANLRTLLDAGVPIAIGSDGISGEKRFVTGRDEVRFLAQHGLMTPLELLRAWAVHTPRTIFPGRRLGSLDPGFEANFLVLNGDPLAGPENLHRIGMRVKRGLVLPTPPWFVLGRE